MTNDPERGTELLNKLRDDVAVPMEAADVIDARRARMVPAIESFLVRRQKEQQRAARRHVVLGGLALAATIALVFGGVRLLSRPAPEQAESVAPGALPTELPAEMAAMVEEPGGATVDGRPAVRGEALKPRAQLRTQGGSARIALPNGAKATLRQESALEVGALDEAKTALTLVSGAVDVEVPRLKANHALTIATEVAAVVVHGTRFSVEAGHRDTGAPWMKVSVSEGEVAVLQHGVERARLLGGDVWTSDEATTANAPSTASATPTAPPPVKSSVVASARPSASAAAQASELEAQNRSYASAMQAKARGDDRAEIEQLQSFLAKWPESPLAPEARAELARARARSMKP